MQYYANKCAHESKPSAAACFVRLPFDLRAQIVSI